MEPFKSRPPQERAVRLRTGREVVGFRFGRTMPSDPDVEYYFDLDRSAQAHALAIAVAAAHGPDKWAAEVPRVVRSISVDGDGARVNYRVAGTDCEVVYLAAEDVITYRRHKRRAPAVTVVMVAITPGRVGGQVLIDPAGDVRPWEMAALAGALATAWHGTTPGDRRTTAAVVAELSEPPGKLDPVVVDDQSA